MGRSLLQKSVCLALVVVSPFAFAQTTGVAVLSGTAFGQFGEGYLRFSIANSYENLAKALDRIEEWTKKNL